MFSKWISNLQVNATADDRPERYWFEQLTAVLLLELARADSNIDEAELKEIEQAIKSSSTAIPQDEVEKIVSDAKQQVESSVSLHNHVREINESFNHQQKLLLIEQMWRVAYADNDLDKYEEYTLRKLAELLYVNHADFIRTKLQVLGH